MEQIERTEDLAGQAKYRSLGKRVPPIYYPGKIQAGCKEAQSLHEIGKQKSLRQSIIAYCQGNCLPTQKYSDLDSEDDEDDIGTETFIEIRSPLILPLLGEYLGIDLSVWLSGNLSLGQRSLSIVESSADFEILVSRQSRIGRL